METSQVSYVGQVLDDGHLSVNPKARKALRLRPGDQLRVTLARGEVSLDFREFQSLEDLSRADLKRIADFRFSRRLQSRMEELLVKNQAGKLTSIEDRELQRLSQEPLIRRARKAQARLVLSLRAK